MYIQKQGLFMEQEKISFKDEISFRNKIIKHLCIHFNGDFDMDKPCIKIKTEDNYEEAFSVGITGILELNNINIKEISFLRNCHGYIEMEVE